MPLSMRRQTARLKRNFERRNEEQANRMRAVALFKHGCTPRNVASACHPSRATTYRLFQATKLTNRTKLHKLLNPVDFKPGRPTTLSRTEEEAIVERVIYAGQRGFAFDANQMKRLIADVTADGRVGYKRGVPSDAAIRSFRARNRSLTFSYAEDMSHKYFAGENIDHVKTLSTLLTELQKQEPDLFQDPDRISNLDETAVNASHGRRLKVFSASSSHLSGRRHDLKENGKHLTAVVIVSSSGKLAPPFLIAEGKKCMPKWMEEIKQDTVSFLSPKYKWLGYNTWIPTGTVVRCSPKGSMDRATLTHVVKHFSEFARQFVSPSKSLLLLLDGHSSRKGTEWLVECEKLKIHVIQLPANTSHFLQPCDSHKNKHFKEETRSVRDVLLGSGEFSHANMCFKMKLTIAGYRTITPEVVKKSFVDVGMWPMDNIFVDRLREKLEMRADWKSRKGETDAIEVRISNRLRTKDESIYRKIQDALSSHVNPTAAVTEVGNILQNNRSTNRVIWEAAPLRAPVRVVRGRVASDGGTPALRLTQSTGKENKQPPNSTIIKKDWDASPRKIKERTERLYLKCLDENLPPLFKSVRDDSVPINKLVRRRQAKKRRGNLRVELGEGPRVPRGTRRSRMPR